MAAILKVVSKRMVIPALEGTVKLSSSRPICRLVTSERRNYCIKFGNFEPHFLLRGDMARGSPGMKLIRLPRQFRVQFRPL